VPQWWHRQRKRRTHMHEGTALGQARRHLRGRRHAPVAQSRPRSENRSQIQLPSKAWKASPAAGWGLTPRSSGEHQRRDTGPALQCRLALSVARARCHPVGAPLARTLGPTRTSNSPIAATSGNCRLNLAILSIVAVRKTKSSALGQAGALHGQNAKYEATSTCREAK
jgi:hypothetical protein